MSKIILGIILLCSPFTSAYASMEFCSGQDERGNQVMVWLHSSWFWGGPTAEIFLVDHVIGSGRFVSLVDKGNETNHHFVQKNALQSSVRGIDWNYSLAQGGYLKMFYLINGQSKFTRVDTYVQCGQSQNN